MQQSYLRQKGNILFVNESRRTKDIGFIQQHLASLSVLVQCSVPTKIWPISLH